jgi:hypothetical protein
MDSAARMIGMYAILAVALIAAGAAFGIVALVTLGIRNEERASRHDKAASLLAGSPGRAASGARFANGVYTRSSQTAYPVGHPREKLLILNGELPVTVQLALPAPSESARQHGLSCAGDPGAGSLRDHRTRRPRPGSGHQRPGAGRERADTADSEGRTAG